MKKRLLIAGLLGLLLQACTTVVGANGKEYYEINLPVPVLKEDPVFATVKAMIFVACYATDCLTNEEERP